MRGGDLGKKGGVRDAKRAYCQQRVVKLGGVGKGGGGSNDEGLHGREDLSFLFDAFSLREPVSTSLENALARPSRPLIAGTG
jgi:hypothetical protein